MLVAVGVHMRQFAASMVDGPKADAEFAAQAGAGAAEEMLRLAGEPVVRESLFALRNRTMVDQTSKIWRIELALLLSRVGTKGQANPLATGEDASCWMRSSRRPARRSTMWTPTRPKSMERFLGTHDRRRTRAGEYKQSG